MTEPTRHPTSSQFALDHPAVTKPLVTNDVQCAFFDAAHEPFSNFYESAPFVVDGVTYPTLEHFYQCSKTLDAAERERMVTMDAPSVHRYGHSTCNLREGWDEMKSMVMLAGIRARFSQHEELKELLLATGNDWFWDLWISMDEREEFNGENEKGKLLLRVREELRGEGEET